MLVVFQLGHCSMLDTQICLLGRESNFYFNCLDPNCLPGYKKSEILGLRYCQCSAESGKKTSINLIILCLSVCLSNWALESRQAELLSGVVIGVVFALGKGTPIVSLMWCKRHGFRAQKLARLYGMYSYLEFQECP